LTVFGANAFSAGLITLVNLKKVPFGEHFAFLTAFAIYFAEFP